MGMKNILALARASLSGDNDALAKFNDVLEENEVPRYNKIVIYYYVGSSTPLGIDGFSPWFQKIEFFSENDKNQFIETIRDCLDEDMVFYKACSLDEACFSVYCRWSGKHHHLLMPASINEMLVKDLTGLGAVRDKDTFAIDGRKYIWKIDRWYKENENQKNYSASSY